MQLTKYQEELLAEIKEAVPPEILSVILFKGELREFKHEASQDFLIAMLAYLNEVIELANE